MVAFGHGPFEARDGGLVGGHVGVGPFGLVPVAVPHAQVGAHQALHILFVEDDTAVVGFDELAHLAGLVVAVGMGAHPVLQFGGVGALHVVRIERFPVAPGVVVVKPGEATLGIAEDEDCLATVLGVAGQAVEPQVDDAHALLLVEGQAEGGVADVGALLEGVELVWSQEAVPGDVPAVVAVFQPGAAGLPLGADVFGQVDVFPSFGREALPLFLGNFGARELGQREHVVDQYGVADVHVAVDRFIVDVGTHPAAVPIRGGVQLGDEGVEVGDAGFEVGQVAGLAGIADEVAGPPGGVPADSLAGDGAGGLGEHLGLHFQFEQLLGRGQGGAAARDG